MLRGHQANLKTAAVEVDNMLNNNQVKAEFANYDRKDMDRKRFLKKISNINDTIIDKQSKG